jgi:hypothetical protein
MDTDQLLMQDPNEIRKVVVWGTMFERHGCLICESKSNLHAGYGFCLACAKVAMAKWDEKQNGENQKKKAKAKKR